MYILLYILLCSLITFLLFGIDKFKARHHFYRIPERTLLLFSIGGGALGGLLGMWVFHHKIRHPKFFLSLPVMIFLQAVLLYLYIG